MILEVTLTTGLYVLGWNGLHMPLRAVTPGEARDIATHEVCTTAWSKDARHVTASMKRLVCARYGVKECPGPKWEIDHLIPRELGGADVAINLWPQPITEAKLKDTVENFLHRAVCGGSMTLEAAQAGIREDWTQEYRKMKDER